MRVLCAFRAQAVADDLLHLQMNVEIEKAVTQPYLQCGVRVRRNEADAARIMTVEIFDDETGFRYELAAPGVFQHREPSDRRKLQERFAFGRTAEVDLVERKRRFVLIERDQRLPAERRQRMVVQRERHEDSLAAAGIGA